MKPLNVVEKKHSLSCYSISHYDICIGFKNGTTIEEVYIKNEDHDYAKAIVFADIKMA